jgi:hypothetical protein
MQRPKMKSDAYWQVENLKRINFISIFGSNSYAFLFELTNFNKISYRDMKWHITLLGIRVKKYQAVS